MQARPGVSIERMEHVGGLARRRGTASRARPARRPTRGPSAGRCARPRRASAARRPTRSAGRRRDPCTAPSTSPTAATAACDAAARPRRTRACDRARRPRTRRASANRLAADLRHRGRRPPVAHPTAAPCRRPSWKHVADSGSGCPPHSLARRIASSAAHSKRHRGFAARQRQALERHFGDDTERAERAGHEARHVEAGHVLHHLAAERQVLARRRRAPSRRARGRAPRPRRDGAARTSPTRRRRRACRPRPKRGGSNASIWPRARIALSIAASDVPARAVMHELGRLVVDDARVHLRVEQRRRRARRRRSPWCRRRECAAACRAAAARIAGLQRLEGRIHHARPAAFSLSRYRMRGSSASMTFVSASAAASHSRRNGWREQRGEVLARRRRGPHVVGLEPKRDRAHRTRRRARTRRTGTVRPCRTGAALGPDLLDARDVGGERVRPGTHVDALADAHRHLVAQRRESPSASRRRSSAPTRARPGRPATCRGCRSARYSPIASESHTWTVAVVQRGDERRRRERAVVGVVRAAQLRSSLRGTARRTASSRASRAATTTSSSCCRCRACT